MPHRLTLIALALYAGSTAAEAPATAVVVNHNHSRQIAALKGPLFQSFPKGTMPQGGAWLGLHCDASGCEVKEATVAVMSGTIADCADEEAYAETVFAAGNPVAVFNGLALRPGKVATALLARKEPPAGLHFSKLRKLGQWQAQLGVSHLGISWVRMRLPKSPGEYTYRYHLYDGAAKQFIFSSNGARADKGGAVTPFVHWAGDLDRDGKLDLLVEIPYRLADDADADAQCEVTYRLYLSSQAKDGEVLRKAAQTAGTQPACGCGAGQADR